MHTNIKCRLKEVKNGEPDKQIEQWKKMAGAMIVRRGGKTGQGLRVVAQARTPDGKGMEEVFLKPSTLARHLLVYTICQYMKHTNKAAEAVVMTIPGM